MCSILFFSGTFENIMAYQNEIYKVEWEFKKYTNADKLRYTGLLYLPLFAAFAAVNSPSRMNI